MEHSAHRLCAAQKSGPACANCQPSPRSAHAPNRHRRASKHVYVVWQLVRSACYARASCAHRQTRSVKVCRKQTTCGGWRACQNLSANTPRERQVIFNSFLCMHLFILYRACLRKFWGAPGIQLQRSEVCRKRTTCGGHQDRLKLPTGVWRAAQLSTPLRTSSPHRYAVNKNVAPGRSVRKKSAAALYAEFAK